MPPRGGEYAQCVDDSSPTLLLLLVRWRFYQEGVRHRHSSKNDGANFAVVDQRVERSDLSEGRVLRCASAWHCYKLDRHSTGSAARSYHLALVA